VRCHDGRPAPRNAPAAGRPLVEAPGPWSPARSISTAHLRKSTVRTPLRSAAAVVATGYGAPYRVVPRWMRVAFVVLSLTCRRPSDDKRPVGPVSRRRRTRETRHHGCPIRQDAPAVLLVMRRTREPATRCRRVVARRMAQRATSGPARVREEVSGKRFGLAMGMVSDAALAEDIAQEACCELAACAGLRSRRGASPPGCSLSTQPHHRRLAHAPGGPTDPDDLVNLGLASSEVSPGVPAAVMPRTPARGFVSALAATVVAARRRALVPLLLRNELAEITRRREAIHSNARRGSARDSPSSAKR